MNVQFFAAVALLFVCNCVLSAPNSTKADSNKQIKQMFLPQIKMPDPNKNIDVVKLASSPDSSDFLVFVKDQVPAHKHVTHTESVYVLEGTGILTIDGKAFDIGPGHYVKIPPGAVHGVKVTSKTPIKVLSIQAPEFFGKDRVKP